MIPLAGIGPSRSIVPAGRVRRARNRGVERQHVGQLVNVTAPAIIQFSVWFR